MKARTRSTSAGYTKLSGNRWRSPYKPKDSFGDFRCLCCHNLVLAQPILSGVHNRNHCPYCLWSRHVDLFKAGDRLAACKAPMQPIGLTLKRTRDKYAVQGQGELMLIHRCTECEGVSINRIAADDDAQALLALFESSQELETEIESLLKKGGVTALRASDLSQVRAQLFGKN